MANISEYVHVPGSFRDPSGFVFTSKGTLYRQINKCYKDDFDRFIASGLYEELVSSGLLIGHEDTDLAPPEPRDAYKVIRPEPIPFISYPYEWCFSQLKDAALLTLKIQELALEHNMTLKDASAYNIQFRGGKPVFIDTLSFEQLQEGEPWIAYRQFCQHFLAPLALMSLRDIRLGQLLRVYIDGVPLDLAGKLLPFRARFRMSLLMHVYLHARSQARYADAPLKAQQATGEEKIVKGRVSLTALRGLIDSLRSAVDKLQWKPRGTEWGDYYGMTNYSSEAMKSKGNLVSQYIKKAAPESVWDLGANTGLFSRIASGSGIRTVSFDIDPAAVEKNYRYCREKGEKELLPLIIDLTNPTPSLGWQNKERESISERGPADMVLALALIHHLAISNNVPLFNIADYFSRLCTWLVMEFVPKSDSQVRKLLSSREDIFPSYTQGQFEQEFQKFFTIVDSQSVSESERTLYLLKVNDLVQEKFSTRMHEPVRVSELDKRLWPN